MTGEGQRVLSLAVRRGQVGMIYFENRDVKDWHMSKKAGRSPDDAQEVLKEWIDTFVPHVVISQNPDCAGAKKGATIDILRRILDVISDAHLMDIIVTKAKHGFRDMYEEAEHLAKKYPKLTRLVPQRPKFWMTEPRRLVYFEALAMADQVFEG